jgi:hypothetical protein
LAESSSGNLSEVGLGLRKSLDKSSPSSPERLSEQVARLSLERSRDKKHIPDPQE